MPTTIEEARSEAANEVALTERWEKPKLKPHYMQSMLMHHKAQYKWCPAGRRSGKTEVAKRDTVMSLIIDNDSGPQNIIIGAPTYTRVKDIYFDDLVSMIPKHWVKRIKESTSELEIRTHWGARIRLVGMNNPKVVEGTPWTKGVFDELADYPERCFDLNIFPAFSTEGREARAMLIGVPDEEGPNQAEYEKYYEIGLRYPERPEHCSFWWPSTDILSADKIEAMAAGMDSDTFRQELLGLFVSRGNKAFPTFNTEIHVDPFYCEYCPFLPIAHSLDFGVRPVCSLICQTYKGQIWILDEIVLDDGSTEVAAEAFIARCGERGYDLTNGIEIYGDAAGRTPGQNIGVSDYKILKQHYSPYRHWFKNNFYNPERKDTVNAIRTKLRNYQGRASIFIHPRCVRLIEDMKRAPWPDKLDTFHCLAALRYYVYKLSEFASSGGVTGVGRADLTENQLIDARYTR